MEKDDRKWSKREWNENGADTTKTTMAEDTKNEDIDRNGTEFKDENIEFEFISCNEEATEHGDNCMVVIQRKERH